MATTLKLSSVVLIQIFPTIRWNVGNINSNRSFLQTDKQNDH
jgi:hypothetical protein